MLSAFYLMFMSLFTTAPAAAEQADQPQARLYNSGGTVILPDKKKT